MATEIDLPDPDLVTEGELDDAIGEIVITTPVPPEGEYTIEIVNGRVVFRARTNWSIQNSRAQFYDDINAVPVGTQAIADFDNRSLSSVGV